MASKSKGNNEGSIRERKPGQWEGRVTIGINPVTGNPKRVSYYGKSRQEVAAKITDALSKLQNGTFVEPNRVTLEQWLNKWMEVYQKDISPNFQARRKDLIRIHIVPAIGSIPILKLKPADIKQFYNDLEKSGRKPAKLKNGKAIPLPKDTPPGLATGTIRHIHNILNPAMKQAVREGLVPKNVVADVSPPKIIRTREARSLTKDEAKTYLDSLKENRLYAAFITELTTGLRRGELIGLQWSDLDMKTGALKIRRQVSRIRHNNGTTSLEYAPLKTPAAYRTIILPAITVTELKAHKARQAQEKLLAGNLYDKKENLIFCTSWGEKLDTRHLYRIHCQALEDAKIEHTAFHNLRHTVATLLLQSGENLKVVQDLLGHADAETTMNTYAHVLEEMKRSAADTLDSIFSEALPQVEPVIESDLAAVNPS